MSKTKKSSKRDLTHALQLLKKVLWEWEYPTAYWQQLRHGLGMIPYNRRSLSRCHPTTRDLLKLFLHDEAVAVQNTQAALNKNIIKTLREWDFLTIDENKNIVRSKVRIIPLQSRFLLLHPHAKQKTPHHPVYLGADSLMFSRFLLPRKKSRKVLDVGTGTGILLFSLPWQDDSRYYLGIDVNSQAIEMAQLNAALNNTPWIRFQQLDLQDGLAATLDTRFDLVIGNLPIIPTPTDPRCKWHGRLHVDGGPDGQKYLRMVLQEIPKLLEQDGEAQFLACSLGSSTMPFLLEEMQKWMDETRHLITVVALKKIPVEIDAYFRSHGNKEQYNIWMRFFQQERAEAWYRLIVRIHDKKTKKTTRLQYLETLRTDFFEPVKNKKVDKRRVVLNFPHYLVEVGFARKHVKIEQLLALTRDLVDFINTHWKQLRNLSIKDGGMYLKEHFPEVFPTSGAAMLSWGSCIEELDQKPPQLTRKLL